ncbi:unnamed protein product [Bemisia tabaci]|uniref:Ionotropic receptor n=1 Tax=Bemisia tabaci TaxID=7038 RepID=A0A9P0AIT2_BEMTA|nr:unnamed protein product [Bemisia tabaci]
MCEEEITLSLTELEGTSELADRNYNVTEGLYNNPIWNSNNLLIFVLNNFDQNDSSSNTSLGAYCKKERDIAGMHDALVLTFKFFWRFFRGHKTVICLAINCARYDPFTQKIVWQSDEDNEIFDFSVNDLHGKSMRVVDQSLVETKGLYDGSFEFSLADIISNIFISLESSINCRFDFDFVFLQELNPEPNYYEAGHKGADFHFLNLVATQDTVNLQRFDHSIGVESKATCIITPHSEFMPQLLVGFKSFTFVVWIFILISAFAFFLMQYFFQRLQYTVFQKMYTEADASLYESTSSLLTVYAYFICGSPPTLLLGRFITGKILFLIFSCFASIISTLFLSGMTTLLTDRVQYPEINSLEDLAASDLLVQTLDENSAARYLAHFEDIGELTAKLTSSMAWYINSIFESSTDDKRFAGEMDNFSRTGLEGEMVKHVMMNTRTITAADAILVSIPSLWIKHNSIKLKIWLPKGGEMKYDYHLIEECLTRNPHSFSFLKNMFLNDLFEGKVAQFMESGHVKKIVESFYPLGITFDADLVPAEDGEPRPYGMDDLQSAFISLIVGLFLSFLLFVGELLADNLQNWAIFKRFIRLKTFI